MLALPGPRSLWLVASWAAGHASASVSACGRLPCVPRTVLLPRCRGHASEWPLTQPEQRITRAQHARKQPSTPGATSFCDSPPALRNHVLVVENLKTCGRAGRAERPPRFPRVRGPRPGPCGCARGGSACVRLCTLLSAARGLRASLPLNALCSRVVNQPHGSQVAAARSTRLPVAFASGRLQPRARPRPLPPARPAGLGGRKATTRGLYLCCWIT